MQVVDSCLINQVVRRRKTSSGTGRPTSSQHRASFPMVRPQLSESKAAVHLEQTLQPNMPYENGDNSSSEKIDGTAETISFDNSSHIFQQCIYFLRNYTCIF